MISDIRQYFDTQIKLVDAEIEAFDLDVFGDNEPDSAWPEKYYNLVVGQTTIAYEGNHVFKALPIRVDLYGRRGRDVIGLFDEIYEKALQIADCVIEPIAMKNQSVFDDIEATLVAPVALDTDDQNVKIEISFIVQVRTIFC